MAHGARHALQVNGEALIAWDFASSSGDQAKTILLVHGWMSGARYMMALADALCRAGYRVICFDLPAHGRSGGRTTNLSRCADALRHVIGHFGPVDTIIAHSFGGAVTAWAFTGEKAAALRGEGHIILLASPNQLSGVTAGFAAQLGLSSKAQRAYEHVLCKPFGRALASMSGNALFAATPYRITAIHSRDDAEVGVEAARELSATIARVHLVELDGLGHRRILYHKDAMEAVLSAVAG